MQNRIECLLDDRKYQTLSSLPKSIKEYQIFKFYIDLEEKMFSLFSTQNRENQLEDSILSTFEIIKEQKHILQYFIDLLVYYLLIRQKQTEITCNLLSTVLSSNENQRLFMTETIQNNKFYRKNFIIQDILYSKRIIEAEPENYAEQKKNCFYKFDEGSLGFILKENDVDSLKEFHQRNNDINKDNDFYISKNSQFSLIFTLNRVKKNSIPFKLLDFCSFYSSYDCFQFLQMNGFHYGNYTNILSVAGGNFSIINILEQNEISFDYCFEASVQHHQLNVTEWLLTNYKCEIISLTKPIKYFEYKTLFFMLLNDIDINKGKHMTPLYALCQQKEINVELIKYFIDKGADLNREGTDTHGKIITPLLSLCQQKEINAELIKYFIEKGADVNKGKYNAPLYALCQQKEINAELIKFLIDHGADVNKGGYYESPLFALCQHEEINDDVIKYLVGHGADVNKGNLNTTPLLSLCQQKEANIELIKYLIEHGADVNKGNIFSTPLVELRKQEEINTELIKYIVEHGADASKESEILV